MISVFHLVNLSLWPSAASLIMMLSFMMVFIFMKYGVMFKSANLVLISILILWSKDVMRESDLDVNHGYLSNKFFSMGMILFISSETMFLVSFFRCHFDFVLVVDVELGVWPPKGILSVSPFSVPLLNTLILLSSGAFITWTHFSILMNSWYESLITLVSTPGSGSYFLAIQYMEHSEVPHGFMMSGYGSISFLATGLHGFHVMLGCVMILASCVRIYNMMMDGVSHYNFEFSAWYWHFADVVRSFLSIFIYWWGP